MTPAERDAVRLNAARTLLHHAPRITKCHCDACRDAHAILRYVPAGDATAPSPWRVRPDGCGMVAISLDAPAWPHVVAAMEPDAARRLAHALHAAADAAEES